MNSAHVSIIARIALLAIAASGLSACAYNHDYYEPSPYYGSADGHYGDYYGDYYDYWYYPAIGAYYDPRVSLYFYYEHDHWVRARELPRHYHPHLGRHVVVRSPHDRPYAEHYRHRERYAPERYRDERYTKPVPERGDGGAWIGAPRKPESAPRNREPERERNQHRPYDDVRKGKYQEREPARERNSASQQPKVKAPARVIRTEDASGRREDNARRSNGNERNAVPAQPQYRERPQAQLPRARTQDMPRPASDRREPAAGTETRRQQEKAQLRTHGKEAGQQDTRRNDEPRGNGRRNGKPDPAQQPGEDSAPDTTGQ